MGFNMFYAIPHENCLKKLFEKSTNFFSYFIIKNKIILFIYLKRLNASSLIFFFYFS